MPGTETDYSHCVGMRLGCVSLVIFDLKMIKMINSIKVFNLITVLGQLAE